MGDQKALGEFEMIVMAAVIRLSDEAYGARIGDEIERRTGRSVSVGAIYTTLTRLQTKGYVRSWLGESTPERGGRAKRHFAITAAGQRRLEKSVTALGNMLEGVVSWRTTGHA